MDTIPEIPVAAKFRGEGSFVYCSFRGREVIQV